MTEQKKNHAKLLELTYGRVINKTEEKKFRVRECPSTVKRMDKNVNRRNGFEW